MKLGILMSPGAHCIELCQMAEQRGFDSAWFVDSPAVFGDAYVSMAAVAARTSTLRLATGVSNPITRRPLITAASIASLSAFAPGRIVFGIGVGHSGTAALGLPRAKLRELEAYIARVRGLLRGEEIQDADGIHQALLNQGLPWLNLGDEVPIVVAAAGPKTLSLAGRAADGVLLGGVTDPGIIERCIQQVASGSVEGLGSKDFDVCVSPSAYISDRAVSVDELRELIGPKSLGPARNFLTMAREVYGADAALPTSLERTLKAFEEPANGESESDGRSHLRVYGSYMTRLTEWQRPLIGAETLEMTSIAGTPDLWLEKLGTLKAAGIATVIVSPLPHLAQETIEQVGRWVIPNL
jgi:5,10-methylenetetrahydromethanopterin reductase